MHEAETYRTKERNKRFSYNEISNIPLSVIDRTNRQSVCYRRFDQHYQPA